MLELYHHGSSVCAAKVRLCLAEKDLAWKSHYLDILKGEQYTPQYAKLNPKLVVPTLVHDGRVIRESTLICEYLDEVFPEPPLKPAAPFMRAEMRIWTKAVDEDIHNGPVGTLTFVSSHRYTVLRLPDDRLQKFLRSNVDPVKRERKRRWVEEGFEAPDVTNAVRAYDKFVGAMETRLSDGPWLAGDDFSLADIAAAPYIVRLDMLQMSEFWTRDRPNVADWFDRIRGRPTFHPAFIEWMPADLTNDLRVNGAKSWPSVRAILQALPE
jgi:glutathione S-transferase